MISESYLQFKFEINVSSVNGSNNTLSQIPSSSLRSMRKVESYTNKIPNKTYKTKHIHMNYYLISVSGTIWYHIDCSYLIHLLL